MNKKINLSGVDKSTCIRTVLMIISFVLPFSSEQVSEFVSFVFAAITSFAAWWKNNSFTELAQKADEFLKEKK